jgi:nitroreductase/ferredoxin
MMKISVSSARCTRCGRCQRVCPMKLFNVDPQAATTPKDDANERCLACGHCVAACPTGAILLDGVRPDTLESANGPLPGFDDVRRLVVRRRSVRLYQNRLVPKSEVARIIDAARWSPTAMNRQQVGWTVVMQPERVKEIAGQVVEYMRLKGGRDGIVGAWDHGFDPVMRGAPHFIAAHAATDDRWAQTDCVVATTMVDLLARAAGIGTCWGGFFLLTAQEHRPIADALGIPADHTFYGGLMLGYPLAAYLRIPVRKPAAVSWLD